jgi:hypothetical protein
MSLAVVIPTIVAEVTQPISTEAGTCYQQTLDVARHQQPTSLKLQAGMSLARLWQCQGTRDEARQLLAEVYGWCTEGFDTADVQGAKVLLEACS